MQVNLLIIESDNYFRKNLVRRLPDEKKWRILFAENRIEALKIVRRKNIDVVLLGLKDLKKEGLMILQELKNVRPLTEVITINRADQIALSIEGMKLGAFDDFIGPFDLESLVRRIREAHQNKKENEKTQKTSRWRLQGIRFVTRSPETEKTDIAPKFIGKEKKSLAKQNKEE